jgi:hypothetical protein
MALVTISNRDKKMIIWNFMEELWKYYQNAIEKGLPTKFYFKDCNFIGTLDEYLCNVGVRESVSDIVIWEILNDYASDKGYFQMDNDSVTLTENGLRECQKALHDWD